MTEGGDLTHEALLREIVAAQAGLSAQVDGIGRRVDGVVLDAREARDGVRDLSLSAKTQDLPAKIAELKGIVDRANDGFRSDLVNSITKVTAEVRAGHAELRSAQADHETRIQVVEGANLNTRIQALENARHRLAGATGLIGWISRNAPWLVTAAVALVAMFETKGHQP